MAKRAELSLALRRDSAELERELVEQRVDGAYERIYQLLEPAATYLRSVLDEQGLRALKQCEAAFHVGLEHAARSGLGCATGRRVEIADAPRHPIPASQPPVEQTALTLPEADPDQVLRVGFRG